MNTIYRPFPWTEYSKKVQLRIDTPYCVGTFTKEDAIERSLEFAQGVEGGVYDGNKVVLYWLIDPEDGVIIDARFQAFGNTALIAAAEIACELVIGKNYDQAHRITADLIDKHVRDKNDIPAFPQTVYPHLNMVVDAIEAASMQCGHIPLAHGYVAPPVMGHEIQAIEGGYPGFLELATKQQLALLEEVIASDIRPYIELDAGGIEVLNITKNGEVSIAYQGSCTSCHSATGATLSYIQHVLRAKLHPDLVVVPEL